MRKLKRKLTSVRTSINVKPIFLNAMELVKKTKGVGKSTQVEFGLQKYLEEHRELLNSKGMNIWDR